jgi:hypothetical protein
MTAFLYLLSYLVFKALGRPKLTVLNESLMEGNNWFLNFTEVYRNRDVLSCEVNHRGPESTVHIFAIGIFIFPLVCS